MFRTTKIVLVLTLLILATSKKPVVRWIHGINAPCSSQSLEKVFKDFDFKCVETNVKNRDKNAFDQEIQNACDVLLLELPNLQSGFTLLGVSQGGLIARGVLQRCEAGKFIRRLLTLGAPHNGVAIVPMTSPNNPINIIAIKACYAQTSKYYIGPCSYIRSLRYYKEFTASRNTVYDLNNEGEFNPQYMERMQGLELFMAIGYDQDRIIQPRNSAVFGFYKDEKYTEFVEMEHTDFYLDNRTSLKSLNEEGRLFRCVLKGGHLNTGTENIQKLIADFAEVGSQKYKDNLVYAQKYCKFNVVG